MQHITQANISHIEKGKVKSSDEGIEKIAKILGIMPEELKYGVIEQVKDKTISSQRITIGLLQAEVERFRKG
jgi:ribosome-binding protein aMBF1 (putative translation factor)